MEIKVSDKYLKINLNLLEKILALHTSFKIPLDHITNISEEKPIKKMLEFRLPGTCFFGIIKAGTFISKNEKAFWYYTAGNQYLNIELKDEYYKRIILGVKNPKFYIESIRINYYKN